MPVSRHLHPTHVHFCESQIPLTLSYDEAATIPLCYHTAALGLYGTYDFAINGMSHRGIGLDIPVGEGAGKYKDEPILITGGASSVGQYGAYIYTLPLSTSRSSHIDILYSHPARKALGIQSYYNHGLQIQRTILSLSRRHTCYRLQIRPLYLPRNTHNIQHHLQTDQSRL